MSHMIYEHKYIIITVRNLGEMLTLSSELSFLAGLVFWFYYIVLQAAILFQFIKTSKSSCLNKIHVLFMKINWLVWLVFNMYQYIILLSCKYMYKVRCTCDGLHIWKLTVKPLCAAPTSCKWLTPISNHQSKTKKFTIKSIHYSWNLS